MIRLDLQIEFKGGFQVITELQLWLFNLHLSLGWRWLFQYEITRKNHKSAMVAAGPLGVIVWLDNPSQS